MGPGLVPADRFSLRASCCGVELVSASLNPRGVLWATTKPQKVKIGTVRYYQSLSWTDTWLILPVVICLSQRLSHACLSISRKMVKPRIAHYNSHSLLDLPLYMDTCSNSGANTRKKLQPYGRSAFIRTKPIGLARSLVNLNNSADRTVLALATYLSSVCLINCRW